MSILNANIRVKVFGRNKNQLKSLFKPINNIVKSCFTYSKGLFTYQ